MRLLLTICLCFFLNQIQSQVFVVSSGTDMIISAGSTVNAGGLMLTPNANFKLSNISLHQNKDVVNFIGHSVANRTYKFSSTTETFSGELRIYYQEGELIGHKEESLKIHLHDGVKWHAKESKINNLDSNHVSSKTFSHSLNELALASLNDDSELTVFGNPVTYKLVFRITNSAKVTFYNMEGNLIWNKYLNDGFHYIDILGLPQGLYFLKANQTIKKIVLLSNN